MRTYKPYIFKKKYVFDKIFQNNTDDLKVGYFNINGFVRGSHAEYLDSDINLLSLDYLAVSETWLNNEMSNQDLQRNLKNWSLLSRSDASDNVKHMGLLLLAPKKKLMQIIV